VVTSAQRQRFRQLNADLEEWLAQGRLGSERKSRGLDPIFEPGQGFSFRDYVEQAQIAQRMGGQAPSMIAETYGVTVEDLVALAEIPLDPWPPEWLGGGAIDTWLSRG
jgi:hypothetical protein